MVNFFTYTFTLPTKYRKTQYTFPFTLSLYQPNTVKHNILSHLHFTLSTKHCKTQYIFSATVHFFTFSFYDLRLAMFYSETNKPSCNMQLDLRYQFFFCFPFFLFLRYSRDQDVNLDSSQLL